MIHSKSVKARFLTSTVANALRAVITFATGIVIARGLTPVGYGDLMFLLGSFISIRTLLDMGSSNAFRTFISKKPHSSQFFMYYFAWLGLQLLITLLFVLLISPSDLFERIWLGHSLNMVVFAFLAVFMQQQVWQMIGTIGESSRQTGRVQLLNILVALSYFMMIVALWVWGLLSVKNILIGLLGLYVLAVIIAYRYLKKNHTLSEETSLLTPILGEYWKYCKPLIVLSFIAFSYDFADKWLLQKYGGAAQQGYFQVSFQFAAVAVLATTSVLNVFWKEIAEAWEKKDFLRAENLYRKVSRGLVIISAIVAGFLIPWSEQIVRIVLGEMYIEGWPVLAVMFLYPIHQSLGQVGGAMLLASGYTKRFAWLASFSMLCSIPLTFYVLAPEDNSFIVGLDMGAAGLALKMVLLGVVTVNLQSWVIARCTGWAFDWKYQVVGIPLILGSGYVSKIVVGMFLDMDKVNLFNLILPFVCTGLIYLMLVISILWLVPWLIGLNRSEIRRLLVV